jgi:hypothetical protein
VNSRRSLFCSGPLDLRAQTEVTSARRSDTPPSAVASGFIAAGQVERCYAFFASEQLSPSGRERVQIFPAGVIGSPNKGYPGVEWCLPFLRANPAPASTLSNTGARF